MMHQKHFISHPHQTGHARSRIKTTTNTSNRERSKMQVVSYTRARENNTCFAMTDVISSFSREVKKSHSSLHWDCILFFCRMQSESTQTIEQNQRSQTESKRDLAPCYFLLHVLFSLARVYEAHGPWKNLEGRLNCNLHKNLDFSRLQTKLGSVLSFLENAKIAYIYRSRLCQG